MQAQNTPIQPDWYPALTKRFQYERLLWPHSQPNGSASQHMGQQVWHRWEEVGSAGWGAGARPGGATPTIPGLPAMRLEALAGLISGACSPRAARVGGVTPMFRCTAAPCRWGGSEGLRGCVVGRMAVC
jgi:hypothetical protein